MRGLIHWLAGCRWLMQAENQYRICSVCGREQTRVTWLGRSSTWQDR